MHGKEIYIFKFRTMFVGSEHKLQNLLENNKVLREEYNVKKKLLNDPRTTLIGKFLRRSSLDEIPQFINVINGEMSVIGPRPILIDQVRTYGKFTNKLISIRPGITGLWQVQGRNTIPFNERVKLDMLYIKNVGLSQDLIIFLKTILLIIYPFSRKNRGY